MQQAFSLLIRKFIALDERKYIKILIHNNVKDYNFKNKFIVLLALQWNIL